MLTIFYSPHSTSVDNEAGRASGHANVPLSALGLQQASDLGRHYANQVVDAVLCSDLQRASMTAEIAFGERGVPIIHDTRLREFDYGDMTQIPRDQLKLEQYTQQPFPNGESVAIAVRRTVDFLRDVSREYDGKTIVVIAHSATKYAFEYLSRTVSLEEIIQTRWEWRDVPIWRYEYDSAFSSLEARGVDSLQAD
jgi:broad specificity phosphatase PhoE